MVAACDSVKCTCREVSHSRQPGCWLASSGSFRVCSFRSATEAEQMASYCEQLRAALADHYGFQSSKTKWQNRCEVYLYPTEQRYGAVVGRAAQETLGSSLVTPATGAIKNRRIDLRTDVADYRTEVLPHELTHVLIADHFRDGPPPLWYDEGLALLADSEDKQVLHQRDLRNGINRGKTFALADLLTTQHYPRQDRVGVFYGQCASLASYLSTKGEPRKMHEFARRSQEVGVNLALEETYGIRGVASLEQMWRKSIISSAPIIAALYSRNHNPN